MTDRVRAIAAAIVRFWTRTEDVRTGLSWAIVVLCLVIVTVVVVTNHQSQSAAHAETQQALTDLNRQVKAETTSQKIHHKQTEAKDDQNAALSKRLIAITEQFLTIEQTLKSAGQDQLAYVGFISASLKALCDANHADCPVIPTVPGSTTTTSP